MCVWWIFMNTNKFTLLGHFVQFPRTTFARAFWFIHMWFGTLWGMTPSFPFLCLGIYEQLFPTFLGTNQISWIIFISNFQLNSFIYQFVFPIFQLNCCGIALDTITAPWRAWKTNTKVNSGDADNRVSIFDWVHVTRFSSFQYKYLIL